MPPYRLPRPLDGIEVRVLGCLVEKELSNPDTYPLSLNSLTAAANQKSNRDPVMDLDESDIEAALDRLLPEVLVWRVRSSRVPKWQHNLDSKWDLSPGEKAILAELLLRGEQTPGELRSRTSRMVAIAGLETAHAHLERLAGPELALVEELPRQPGQKETRWRHLMGDAAKERTSRPRESRPSPTPPSRGLEDRVTALEGRVEELALQIRRLTEELGG